MAPDISHFRFSNFTAQQKKTLRWHRMSQALQILSLHLNVPLRLLHRDADERIEQVWRHYDAHPGEHPAPPVEELSRLLAIPPTENGTDPLRENIPEECRYWFCPMPPLHEPSPKPHVNILDQKIYLSKCKEFLIYQFALD